MNNAKNICELKLRDYEKELKFTVKIVGDVNDADYVMEETILSEDSFNKALPYILALFKLNDEERGFEKREELWEQYYSQEEIKALDWHMADFISIPANEWDDAHTIESINITAQKDGMIYDVVVDVDAVLPINK